MKAFFQQLHTALAVRDERTPLPTGFTDDASRLNQTRITEIFALSSAGGSAEDQLRQYLQHVRNTQLPLSIAGMRHTMGGQTFTPGGLVLNMLGLRQMHLDEERNILHVQAGACWSDVLHYLHARHRSIQVMQSNNSFSVGGSLGANCLPGGMMSDVWQVKAGNRRFIAKFYAYCVAEKVTLGGSTPASNAENLAKSRQELERSLENLWGTERGEGGICAALAPLTTSLY